jgi:hypothetical protein
MKHWSTIDQKDIGLNPYAGRPLNYPEIIDPKDLEAAEMMKYSHHES